MRNGNETLFPKIEAILLCYPRTSKRLPCRWSACVNSLCKETRQRENKIKINFQVQVEITHISTDTHWMAGHMMNAPGFLRHLCRLALQLNELIISVCVLDAHPPEITPGTLRFSVSRLPRLHSTWSSILIRRSSVWLWCRTKAKLPAMCTPSKIDHEEWSFSGDKHSCRLPIALTLPQQQTPTCLAFMTVSLLWRAGRDILNSAPKL